MTISKFQNSHHNMFILLIEEWDRREIDEFLMSFVSDFKNVVFVSCSVLNDTPVSQEAEASKEGNGCVAPFLKGLKRSSSPSEEKGREESSSALDETMSSSSGLRFARACWRLETRPEGRKLFFSARVVIFRVKREKGNGIWLELIRWWWMKMSNYPLYLILHCDRFLSFYSMIYCLNIILCDLFQIYYAFD